MSEEALGYVSIVLLSMVGLMCTVGVLSSRFDDTLMQRIGMALVALWCAARVSAKLAEPSTEAIHLMLHAGLLAYALGAWMKLEARRDNAASSIRILSDVETRQVAGAGLDR